MKKFRHVEEVDACNAGGIVPSFYHTFPHVQRAESMGQVRIEDKILSAEWLDNGEKIDVKDNTFFVVPCLYDESYFVRVAKVNG